MSDILENINYDDLDDPYRTIAEKLGMEAALILAEAFGGRHLYFAQLQSIEYSIKARLIPLEFTGYNYLTLAQKYNVTERWVRDLVSGDVKQIRARPPENQITFFNSE